MVLTQPTFGVDLNFNLSIILPAAEIACTLPALTSLSSFLVHTAQDRSLMVIRGHVQIDQMEASLSLFAGVMTTSDTNEYLRRDILQDVMGERGMAVGRDSCTKKVLS